MANRRAFRRFDIITVLEFNLLTAIAGTFAGITKNFSYEGFCLETQCVDFEPGDSMEVTLRHPHSELTVSVPAYVVWKRAADKFACLMGIKVRETELGTRLGMLEIMCAVGDLPVDSVLSAGNDDDIEDGGPITLPPDLNQPEALKAAPQAPETDYDNTEPDASRDEGLLSTERELITGKITGETFNAVFRAAQSEEPETEDMPEEQVESDIPWPRAEEKADTTAYGIASLFKQLQGNRIFIYSLITMVIIGISLYALYLILQRPDSGIKSPVPAQLPAQTAFRQEEGFTKIIPPVQDAGDDKAAVPEIQPPAEHPVSNAVSSKAIEHDSRASLPKPPGISAADDQTRYIQVGAWKDPANAREMLQKIKKYYPEAYLTVGKKLNRVKIPAKNQAEVTTIIKEIEDKFRIKALVSSVK